jgi:murein DD-endopeptidase MepM/ murein hydrolase activator NlpD
VAALLAGLLTFAAAVSDTSAGAAAGRDPRAARDAARTRRAQLAAELNTLRASEAKLLQAAEALQQQVAAQAARVQAAQQAVAVADRQVAEATAALERTRGELASLKQLIVERAVESYMSPQVESAADFGRTGDIAAAARRDALLRAVAASDDALVDELNAAEEDHALARAAAASARDRAEASRRQTEQRLAQLERDRTNAARVAQAVTKRSQEVLAEIDAQSRSEAALSRIITERARAAPPAATAPGSTARSASGCIWPTRGRVTSEYGSRSGRLHAGIDIAAPTGTPIYAARGGTVIFAGQQSGYGNVVIIDHGGGFTTLYAHQSRLGTSDGASVGQGATIGYVGNTGRSTGPHLHFETRYSGSPRNPRSCLP